MIGHLDHVVLTTRDLDTCLDFYVRVLGMVHETFADGTRHALRFGHQKINLHVAGREFEPKADRPTPGSLDLCFIADRSIEGVIGRLDDCDWPIEEGPVERTGAVSKLVSVYVRDPDRNLIEISQPIA